VALLGTRQWAASVTAILNSALLAGLLAFFAIFGLRAAEKRLAGCDRGLRVVHS
jgi:hypothetical protein